MCCLWSSGFWSLTTCIWLLLSARTCMLNYKAQSSDQDLRASASRHARLTQCLPRDSSRNHSGEAYVRIPVCLIMVVWAWPPLIQHLSTHVHACHSIASLEPRAPHPLLECEVVKHTSVLHACSSTLVGCAATFMLHTLIEYSCVHACLRSHRRVIFAAL